ncbi:MAG: septal ring lytic transglycosylase RlpA family protein [Nitrospirae bacterium]|nr:MAG: septal ring lytic transglycosylase RlpA family protein [Nitrospirota bacterium]
MVAILALPACMTVPKGVGDYDAGYVEQGIASWYGGYFHGRPTANGEVYDQFQLTAAHRLLPLGSVVRVTNAENGRVVEVVINDRGPYIRGRIIDLSYAAAEHLGAVDPGTLPVVVEVIQMGPRGSSLVSGRPAVQEPEESLGVGLGATLVHDEGAQAVQSAIYAVGARPGPAYRGHMDVLLDPRRTRRMAEPAEVPEDHPDHAELVEGMAVALS